MQENNQAFIGVCNHIIDGVAQQRYKTGDKLPPERELSAQLGVSRSTIREAMKALTYLGFVECTHGSGNYIADDYDKTLSAVMHVMFKLGRLDNQKLNDFRITLEKQAFTLAVKHVTDGEIKEMQDIVEQMAASTDDVEIARLDKRLHGIIVSASGNPLIAINYNALSSILDEYIVYTRQIIAPTPGGRKILVDMHRGIVDAMAKHDSAAGLVALDEHYAQIYDL